MRTSRLIPLLLLTLASCTQTTPTTQPPIPPATITFKSLRPGKPPHVDYTVRLNLTNRHDRPMWYLMRRIGTEPLPTRNEFIPQGQPYQLSRTQLSTHERADTYREHPITSDAIETFGDPRFISLRLNPHTTLHLDDCTIEAWREPLTDFELWETPEILINAQTPLQTWLASRTLAPEGHYATLTPQNRDPKSPTQIRHGASEDPMDTISSITTPAAHRWTLPITNIDNARHTPIFFKPSAAPKRP